MPFLTQNPNYYQDFELVQYRHSTRHNVFDKASSFLSSDWFAILIHGSQEYEKMTIIQNFSLSVLGCVFVCHNCWAIVKELLLSLHKKKKSLLL